MSGTLATRARRKKAAPVITLQPGRFVVKLRSYGNPDHGQYTAQSDPETFHANSIEEAALECRRYIERWELGGGNWGRTEITLNGKPIAEVSYNGRIWNLDGTEYRQAALMEGGDR